jgi:hypothetical protein
MTLTGLAMIVLVCLGNGLHGFRLAQEGLLVVAAFLAVYLRRLVPGQAGFPLFGFVLCVLSTVLPGGWAQAGEFGLALAAGLVVAFGMVFFVLPLDRRRALRSTARIFCAHAGGSLRALAGRAAGEAARERQTLQALVSAGRRFADGRPGRQALVGDQYEVLQFLVLLEDSLARAAGSADADRVRAPVDGLVQDLAARFERLAGADAGGAPAPGATADPGAVEAAASGATPSILEPLSLVVLAVRRLAALHAGLARGLRELAGEAPS